MQQQAQAPRQVIQVSLEMNSGALMRVTGIMTARGINIDSLSLMPDPERPGLARVTMSAHVDERHRAGIVKEMNGLGQVRRAEYVT